MANYSEPMETTKKISFTEPLNKFQGSRNWDVIVIGSGMGGMACAAALAKYGHKVLVLEQHYVAGGFTHTFTRKGFAWDVGVHCLGQMRPTEMPGRIIQWISDGKVHMESMGPVYETFHFPNNFDIAFPNSKNLFVEELHKKFPDEKEALDRYFKLIKEVNKEARKFLLMKALPRWMGKTLSFVMRDKNNWWGKTTAEVLNTLTKNEKLKTVLTSQWGYYGSTPKNSSFGIHALIVKHFWNGGYYPSGGSQTIAEHVLNVVQKSGGHTLVRASVDKVLVKNHKAIGVRMSDGQEFYAPIIVSAAGAKTTAEKLIPDEYKSTEWAKDILSMHQSPPHICLYIGFEGDIQKAGATKSNQWFFESWDCEIKDWDLNDPNSIAPVLYMSFPSLKDPLHNPGPKLRHTGEVVTFVSWDVFAKWQNTRRGLRDPEYMEFKKNIEQRLMAQLRKHIPQLMDLAVYCELSTPLSTVHFTRAPEGAIYGLEATPKRFTSQHLTTRTPLKGLYLAGGDVATLGVTGALVGGILAACSIESRVFSKIM